MADMVSLKRTKEDFKEIEASVDQGPQDYYPVSIYLSDDEVEKLGLEKCQVGEEKMFIAKVRASSVSSRETRNDDKKQNVTLDVLEASVEKVSSSTDDNTKAKRLYKSEE